MSERTAAGDKRPFGEAQPGDLTPPTKGRERERETS
jgi:hypothetical protein